MKRSLIALGIIAAAAAPMVASAAPTVYGKLNLSVENVQDNTRHGDVVVENSNASRFGVKGESELTASLSAIYGIEWGVSGDGNAADLSQRNRYVGLKSQDWGAIKLGKYDSYLKTIGQSIDPYADLSADNQNVLTGKNRLNNVIGYESPKINNTINFNILVQPGEESVAKNNNPSTNTPDTSGGTATTKAVNANDRGLANAASTSLTFNSEDNTLSLALGYDWHILSNYAAFAGTNTGSGSTAAEYNSPVMANSTGPVFNAVPVLNVAGYAQGAATSAYTDKSNTWRAIAGYNLKDAGLAFNLEYQSSQRANEVSFATDPKSFVKPKEAGWLFNAAWKFAEGWTGRFQYDTSTTSAGGFNIGTVAKPQYFSSVKLSQTTLGADYNFTTTTKVYGFLSYFKATNNNNLNLAGQATGSIGDTVTRKYAAVGIDHKF